MLTIKSAQFYMRQDFDDVNVRRLDTRLHEHKNAASRLIKFLSSLLSGQKRSVSLYDIVDNPELTRDLELVFGPNWRSMIGI